MLDARVKFDASTLDALNSKALSPQKKWQLRVEAIKAYIRSKPVGTGIKVSELQAAGHYGSYGQIWNAINTLIRKGEITRERIPHSTKSVWTVVTPDVQTVKNEVEEEVEEAKPQKVDVPVPEPESKPEPIVFSTIQYQSLDVETIRTIETLAREFSWKNNSDSLREFVKSLK